MESAGHSAQVKYCIGLVAYAVCVISVALKHDCKAVTQSQICLTLSPPHYQAHLKHKGVSRELFRDVGSLMFKDAESSA